MIQLHPLSQLKNYVKIYLLLVKNQVKICQQIRIQHAAKMKLLASPESSTPPEPCLDIGTIITPTKSISDICHTVGNLLNVEKFPFCFNMFPHLLFCQLPSHVAVTENSMLAGLPNIHG